MSDHTSTVEALARATPPSWTCPVVRFHRPKPHVRENHHIYPLGEGGPENGPKAGICGGCHNDAHALLAKAKRNGWKLTPDMHYGYAVRVVEIAELGILAVTSKALPVLPAWAEGSAA